METQTKKQHREFDLNLAQKAYGKVDEELSGETITSPFDLYAVEKLRDDHQLRAGVASPTDVFVFGKGTSEAPYLEPIDIRACTLEVGMVKRES